ncbi:pentapeptide repeat-containing protein [uncultured Hymenobacter sp.]|uniref:pentapeptide repeat-containing protein n=1 Tax=uncultured Hymenobacter sp. TaxID=170016 RepID=UPI0035CA93FF
MRPSSSRKAVKLLTKPAFFPPENLLDRALPASLVGQQEFEQYRFSYFDFTRADISGRRFTECLFENCNFAGTSLSHVALQNVAFDGCKLLGLPFHACRDLLFGVHFNQCQLDYASFQGKVMPNTRFVNCSLRAADFTQTDLSNAVFQECGLLDAVFSATKLNGADFVTARDVRLDPELNQLRQARFALHSLPGLLFKYELVIQ